MIFFFLMYRFKYLGKGSHTGLAIFAARNQYKGGNSLFTNEKKAAANPRISAFPQISASFEKAAPPFRKQFLFFKVSSHNFQTHVLT